MKKRKKIKIWNIILLIWNIFVSLQKNLRTIRKMNSIFGIILALCRASLSNDIDNVKYQIERLANAYKKNGTEAEYKAISSLLKNTAKKQVLNGSKLKISNSIIVGEELTRQVTIPVDKETASPLLEIFFSNDLPSEPPIFDVPIQTAVESVIVEWSNYPKLVAMNAAPSHSCLIYGLPGTGKTHLAKWMANQIGLPVVLARLDGIVSSFLGTSARNISSLFSFANRYKCVLLLDEFDAIAKLRDDPQEVGEVKRIVNALLQNLDERDNCGFTIGVTNHEQLLDPAIWRRFDVQIEIPKPSSMVIEKLLTYYMTPLQLSEAEIRFMSWCSSGSSGADIQKLSNWLKRMKIITEYQYDNIVDLMRRYSILNTGRMSDEIKKILSLSDDDILTKLKGEELNFKQKDIAAIFNISQSTVSKQLAKVNKEE